MQHLENNYDKLAGKARARFLTYDQEELIRRNRLEADGDWLYARLLDRVQHRHVKDEFLVFLGASFPNVFDFDAKIEFTLGKGDEAETYVITKPTIIRIPAGVYHCPLNFKEVNKPVLFLATLFTPMFGGVYDMPNGKTMEMYYNGPVPCKYNPDKKCDSCGKCLQEDWKPQA